MAEKTDMQLLGHIGNCIRSASENYENRCKRTKSAASINYNALDDIESDLSSALKAAKKLFRRRNAEYDANRLPTFEEAFGFAKRKHGESK